MKRLRLFLRILFVRCKFSGTATELFGMCMTVHGLLSLPFDRVRAAGSLMRAHRNTRNVRIQMSLEKLFNRYDLYQPAILDRLVDQRHVESPLAPGRCFKLKEAQGDEKGVIIMKWNDTFTQLHRTIDMSRFLNDYTLCLELSYYGCCNPQILQFMRYHRHQIVVGAVQKLERGYLKRLNSNLVRADYSSSTWVNDKLFRPLGLEKEYDCILIAMWEDLKRHFLLFEAIAEINDPTFRVCLVGFQLHQARSRVEELIDYYGIRKNVTIFESISQAQVNVLLNKSKVNLLLSFKEGGNKSIIEGFFADVPGIVLNEHIGIDLSWINPRTGRLVQKRHLAEALRWFRSEHSRFHPRQWAARHLSCVSSTAKLESTLRDIAVREGRPWTIPLTIKVNAPDCKYYDPTEALGPLDLDAYRKGSRVSHNVPV